MKFGKLSENSYLLRLEKEEEVLSAFASFCERQNVANGQILGLGSVENPTLAHYRVDTKKYSEQAFVGIYEVINLTGTVGIYNDKPIVHVHVGLSDEQMRSFGGHLVKALVSATFEAVIAFYPSSYTKTQNEEIGLKLFDLPETLIKK